METVHLKIASNHHATAVFTKVVITWTIKLLKYQCCYTAVGYVFGYAEGYTTSLQCMPFPFELSSEDTAYRNADVLELTTAFIDVKGVTGVFDERLQNKPIKCAFCHVKNTKTVSQL